VALRPQLRTDHPGGGVLRAAAWAAPVQDRAVADEPLDRLGHVGEPGEAPQLAVHEDVEAHLALHREGVKDGPVLGRAQVVGAHPTILKSRAGCQQLRRAQQAANLICTVDRMHRLTPTV
jgi:hypothetical protein